MWYSPQTTVKNALNWAKIISIQFEQIKIEYMVRFTEGVIGASTKLSYWTAGVIV